MAKQILLPLAGVALFIILIGLFIQKPGSLGLPKYFSGMAVIQEKTISIGDKTLQVKIANTETLREKGLSGKSSLATGTGMLFVFDTKKVVPTFWMKDMLFPLDIIWISDGKIVKIDKNVPAPSKDTPDTKLSKFSPGQPIDYVLEVNAGFAASNNVKVGDSINLSKI